MWNGLLILRLRLHLIIEEQNIVMIFMHFQTSRYLVHLLLLYILCSSEFKTMGYRLLHPSK